MIEPAVALCIAHRVRKSADHVSKRAIHRSDHNISIRKSVMGTISRKS